MWLYVLGKGGWYVVSMWFVCGQTFHNQCDVQFLAHWMPAAFGIVGFSDTDSPVLLIEQVWLGMFLESGWNTN